MANVEPKHVLRGHCSDVQSIAFLSEVHLYSGDCNGELRLWDLASCRAEFVSRLHDANAGILQLACLPAYGVLLSQGRDGCVKLWAAGVTAALDRSQPLHEIRTESFNFCRCAVWAPGDAASGAGPIERAHSRVDDHVQTGSSEAAPGGLRDVFVACAAHDPADVGVWRPAEGPTAKVLLRQGGHAEDCGSETKHGMCMSLAFLAPSAPPLPPLQEQNRQHHHHPNSDPAGYVRPPPAQSGERGLPAGPSQAGELVPGMAPPPVVFPAGSYAAAGHQPLGDSGAAAAVTDPRFVVAGYEDGMVALWDLRSPGRPLGSLRLHGEPVMGLDVRRRPPAGGRSAQAAKRRGGVADEVAVAEKGGKDCKARTGISTEVYDVISCSADDQVSCCVMRPEGPQPVELAGQVRLREAGSADVRIRGDSKLFALGCWDGRVRLYALRRREPLAVLKYHRSQVTAVAFSPETNTLASASRDTTIALWSVYASASVAR